MNGRARTGDPCWKALQKGCAHAFQGGAFEWLGQRQACSEVILPGVKRQRQFARALAIPLAPEAREDMHKTHSVYDLHVFRATEAKSLLLHKLARRGPFLVGVQPTSLSTSQCFGFASPFRNFKTASCL